VFVGSYLRFPAPFSRLANRKMSVALGNMQHDDCHPGASSSTGINGLPNTSLKQTAKVTGVKQSTEWCTGERFPFDRKAGLSKTK